MTEESPSEADLIALMRYIIEKSRRKDNNLPNIEEESIKLRKDVESLQSDVEDLKEIKDTVNKIDKKQDYICEYVNLNKDRIKKIRKDYYECEARKMADLGLLDKLKRDTGLVLIESGVIGSVLAIVTLIMRIVGII